jgi:DnaJ-class molecular chaperone
MTGDPFAGLLRAEEVRARFRELAREAHPDAGGSDAAYAELTLWRDAALIRVARSPCPDCGGSGQEVIARRGFQAVTRTCRGCGGLGRPA